MKNRTFIIPILIASMILAILNCTGDGSGNKSSLDAGDSAPRDQIAENGQENKDVPSGSSKNNKANIDDQSEINLDTLVGRWLRPDGNYVIQINSIQGNQIDAAYFNPRPIHIARAERLPDDHVRIFIEFDDVGYKGSSYDLIYNPENDVLSGNYFQATYGQTYQIAFVRLED